MFGFFSNGPFRGLVSNCCEKMLNDMGLPREAVGAVIPAALMIAHAAYPKGKLGRPELDEAIARLPQPIIGWNEAGKTAHRYVYFHEMTVGQCLLKQYGKTYEALLEYTSGNHI